MQTAPPPPYAPNPFDRAEVTIDEPDPTGGGATAATGNRHNHPEQETRWHTWAGVLIIGSLLVLASGAMGTGIDPTSP